MVETAGRKMRKATVLGISGREGEDNAYVEIHNEPMDNRIGEKRAWTRGAKALPRVPVIGDDVWVWQETDESAWQVDSFVAPATDGLSAVPSGCVRGEVMRVRDSAVEMYLLESGLSLTASTSKMQFRVRVGDIVTAQCDASNGTGVWYVVTLDKKAVEPVTVPAPLVGCRMQGEVAKTFSEWAMVDLPETQERVKASTRGSAFKVSKGDVVTVCYGFTGTIAQWYVESLDRKVPGTEPAPKLSLDGKAPLDGLTGAQAANLRALEALAAPGAEILDDSHRLTLFIRLSQELAALLRRT